MMRLYLARPSAKWVWVVREREKKSHVNPLRPWRLCLEKPAAASIFFYWPGEERRASELLGHVPHATASPSPRRARAGGRACCSPNLATNEKTAGVLPSIHWRWEPFSWLQPSPSEWKGNLLNRNSHFFSPPTNAAQLDSIAWHQRGVLAMSRTPWLLAAHFWGADRWSNGPCLASHQANDHGSGSWLSSGAPLISLRTAALMTTASL